MAETNKYLNIGIKALKSNGGFTDGLQTQFIDSNVVKALLRLRFGVLCKDDTSVSESYWR